MKKLLLILLIASLTSCSYITPKASTPKQVNIKSNVNSNEIDYQIKEPYLNPIATNHLANHLANRMDIDEIEYTLTNISKNTFAPEEFYQEQGQFLTNEALNNLLARKLTQSEFESALTYNTSFTNSSLNPSSEYTEQIKGYSVNPIYVESIFEQNYYTKKDENYRLDGLSFGLVLNTKQIIKVNETEITINYDVDKVIEYGKLAAQDLANYIRSISNLTYPPIVISLYVLNQNNNLIPGKYVNTTVIGANQAKISTWSEELSQVLILPSVEMDAIDPNVSFAFSKLQQNIRKDFNENVFAIGQSRITSGNIKKITLELTMKSKSNTELKRISQLIIKSLQEDFDQKYNIEIILSSNEELELITTRNNNDGEINVHYFK